MAVIAIAGCGDEVVTRQCMRMGAGGEIVSAAERLRVDVYGAEGRCDGAQIAAGSGAPIFSRTFARGEAIALDVSPGKRTLVLSAFADADATVLLGSGCASEDLKPGSKICIDLMLAVAPDMAAPDAAMPDQAVCTGPECPCASHEACPFNQYCGPDRRCMPGCKSNFECSLLATQADLGAPPDGGVLAPGTMCNLDRHTCVECVSSGDCQAGKLCSPAGQCVEGCDLTRGKGCSQASQTCCGNLCVDLRSDVFNCGTCGTTCTGATSSCCMGNCVDTLSNLNHCGGCGNACSTVNATPSCGSGQCSFACTSGFAHCMAGNTGCETDLDGTNQKLCGSLCISKLTCCTVSDCTSTPSPTACYAAPACSSVGAACDYPLKNGSKVCGATCCNAIGGSCNMDCSLSCTSGVGDCDGQRDNGCETNLTNTTTKCGGCNINCNTEIQHASGAACVSSACTYSMCNTNYGNCDSNAANGCETNLTNTTSDCGACDTDCNDNVLNASGKACASSKCTYSSCSNNFDNCDSDATNGCETNLTNTTGKCGSCNTDCNTKVLNATGKACASSNCTYSTCNSNYGNCDGDATNGCETSTLNNDTDCGSSCTNCSNTTYCNGSTCSTCPSGFRNCSTSTTGADCETNINTDFNNCGACGAPCSAGQACCGGVCTNITSSDLHCGGCAPTCGDTNYCNGSSCSNCAAGMRNCATTSSSASCETNITNTTTACGSCTTDCTVTVQNATNIGCSSSTCTFTCNANFGNCDSNATNGCEANTQNNDSDCGASCADCGNTTYCNGSSCSTCAVGFRNCTTSTTGADCETNINTNFNHCGACGAPCSAGQACCGGVCINVTSSDSNCGSCGITCGDTTYCNSTSCSGCAAGMRNCTTSTSSASCETNITNTTTACGSCTTNCNTNVLNATGKSCVDSACTYAACSAGFANCDSDPTDGCEFTSPQHHTCITPKAGVGDTCTATLIAQTFYLTGAAPDDGCRAVGTPGTASTYSLAMATAARNAWNEGSGAVTNSGTCGTGAAYLLKRTNAGCAVWTYTGSFTGGAGYMFFNNTDTSGCGGQYCCFCPDGSNYSGKWD